MPPPLLRLHGLGHHLATHLDLLEPFRMIDAKREELPWLGAPTGDVAVTPNGRGWYRHYESGSIYWTPDTGAHESHGAIRDKWASLGWEQSFLGFPVTDETPTPDGSGRYNHFEGGSIYWTPDTGAWEVHGAIRDKWASLGWERSFLGYPISDEQPLSDGVGRFSAFQRGEIAWSPWAGAGVSATSYEPHHGGGGLHPLGVSSDDDVPEVRRRVVVAAHMDLTDDETFGSNEHSSADLRNEAIVTNDMPQELIRMSDGAGGELRVELRLDAAATLHGDALVSGQALLFEGTSELSDDLDGDEPIKFVAPRNNFTSKTYTVTNEDEGGDFGVITMTVSNFAA
jgi:uncharacterized protein with LGFP repeats